MIYSRFMSRPIDKLNYTHRTRISELTGINEASRFSQDCSFCTDKKLNDSFKFLAPLLSYDSKSDAVWSTPTR